MNFLCALFRLCFGLLLSCLSCQAGASGFSLIEIPGDAGQPTLHGAVWYPCVAHTVPVKLGTVVLQVTPACPFLEQQAPLVVISHGSGGSFLGHHDTAEALAGAGVVVAAISHPGDSFLDLGRQGHLSSFASRSEDIRRLLDYMTRSWRFHQQINPEKIGLFGFSRGGFTGLVLAGAVPDFRQGLGWCGQKDTPMCREIRQDHVLRIPAAETRIRVMVLADPLNLFAPAGLRAVTIPLQFWASATGGDGVTPAAEEELRRGLPPFTEAHVVPDSGHFAFLAPCSVQQQQYAPEICRDQAGFDRAAFHQDFNAQMTGFFLTHLGMPR